MPTYEYRCENGHTFEALQSMSEDALDTCEVCGAPAQRILSAPAIHYKGSGFYTTDYARKGAKKPVGDSAAPSSGGSDGGSSDSKSSGSDSGGSKDKASSSSSGSGSGSAGSDS
jgi:putative FmdB family regulatory protein